MTFEYHLACGGVAVSLFALPLGEKDWCLVFSGVGGTLASVCFPGGANSLCCDADTSYAVLPAQILKSFGLDCVVCMGLLPKGKACRQTAERLIYELTHRFLNDIKGGFVTMIFASVTSADPNQIMSFILGEIPFVLFMALLVYLFWIRPKRKERRESNDPDRKTQIGDELLFKDGMVGIITKYKDGIVTVESGSARTKYQIKDDFFLENISAKERIKEKYKQLSLWQKLLSKI